jgi:hypothetical protein
MKTLIIASASVLAFAVHSAPAAAQSMNMPGMTMPMAAKPKAKKKVAKKGAPKKVGKKAAATKKVVGNNTPAGTRRQPSGMSGMTVPMEHPAAPHQPGAQPMTMPMEHQAMPMPNAAPDSGMNMPMPMDHSQMGGMTGMEHAGGPMAMTGVLGSYPMDRESDGTAWQPDASASMGSMSMSGGWMLMAHGVVNLVADHQSGQRGDDKAFVSGMLMGMARRPLGQGTLQFRAMLSPDPLMGPRGYPLLLASGETANGRDRLIDRQHPHDFFMELSASVSQDIAPKTSIFLYGGLPGEPAFGPPSFMHRESIMDSPEAPITHHWLDSTHITFGVVTAGVVLDRVKIELSRFNAREPDQHRWNIETGPLDSTALRLSWNPTRTLALQGSWAHFVDPEQLEPGVDQKRWSASALWADEVAPGWKLATTLAWGRKISQGHSDDGVALEGSLKHAGWTAFGRAETVQNRELIQGQDEPAFRVAKVSLGAIRDFPVAGHFSLGLGGLFAVNFVPDGLAPLYGGHHPTGAMGFVRVKLN